jgi:hypothetical protein
MHKGCNIYVILALNEKGVVEGLENLPVAREFVDLFPEELPGMCWRGSLNLPLT